MKIAIIGGGAAGCFAAIEIKRRAEEMRKETGASATAALEDCEVTVIEAGKKLLAKVAVTGGGRCNLTNSFAQIKSLAAVYPRGERLMKRLLKEFSHEDAYDWFEREGVKLVTQDDECVFPQSQDAMEIVNTLTRLMRQHGVKVVTSARVTSIKHHQPTQNIPEECSSEQSLNDSSSNRYTIVFGEREETFDAVLVTTGGSPKHTGLSFLAPLELEIVPPVPSLFSLCIPNEGLKALMGTVVENVEVILAGTKLRSQGTILITHWGVSGPAILKLSSYAARVLNEKDYRGQIVINWMGNKNENIVSEELGVIAAKNMQKQLANVHPDHLCARLWQHLLSQAGLRPDQRWGELGRKSYNRLASVLTGDTYPIDGKNRFKEEFVTCGGVALANINPKTLECRTHPGLYFAGEVLDVDAITGGFNLQAAWTMAHVAARGICQ